MHLEALNIFCDVVRHQSFSRGALANSVSQSAASQAVRQIERRLGAQLIDRSRRPWQLTPEGKLFFQGCQEIVDRYHELEEAVQRRQDPSGYTVRLASIYSVGLHDLSQYVDRFREAVPGAHVDIEYMHPDEIPTRIQNDQSDVGLLAFATPGRDLTVVPWRQQAMAVACPPGAPVRRPDDGDRTVGAGRRRVRDLRSRPSGPARARPAPAAARDRGRCRRRVRHHREHQAGGRRRRRSRDSARADLAARGGTPDVGGRPAGPARRRRTVRAAPEHRSPPPPPAESGRDRVHPAAAARRRRAHRWRHAGPTGHRGRDSYDRRRQRTRRARHGHAVAGAHPRTPNDEGAELTPRAPPGPRHAARRGPVRPALRARLVRRRVRREHQGRALAQARPAGVRSLRESPPPRRVRLRGEHGRRRRHAAAASAQVLPQGGRRGRLRAARARRLRRRHGVPAPRRRRAAASGRDLRPHRRRRGTAPARLARRADRQRPSGRHGQERRAGHPPDLHRPRPGARRHRGRRRTLRAQAVRHPQPGGARGRPPAASRARPVLRRQPVVQHHRLQGHADRGSGRADVPRPGGSGRRVGAGARAFAVQHQHVPVVAAGPPVPLHRPQRRDQHAARQHQLDAGARGAVPIRSLRGRPAEAVPARPRGAERHGHVRQRAGVPGPHRPAPGARGPDDDSRAVEQPRVDESGAAGVLRVPRLAHGAVGRTGVDRLHRRHRHRGGARPQRAAAFALLRDEGRHGDHGVRGGRARHPAGERARQGTAASGPHLPGRHGPGAHRRRRGDQAAARGRASLRGVAGARAGARRRPSRRAGRHPASARDGAPPPAGVRLHGGGPAHPRRPDGPAGGGTDRIDGHGHVARGAVGPLPAALRLLQAALRAGHEPAARRDPRGAGDRHGIDPRGRAQPAGARGRVVPPRQGSTTRCWRTASWRSCGT